MKVLLVDVDSHIPNLALMKISAYHKSIGDEVGFNVGGPDVVYASVIFKQNKHDVDGLKFWYPRADIRIGGSGYDLKTELPDEIENIKPDYGLYTDVCVSCGKVKKHCKCMHPSEYTTMQYSIGYSTRGCFRNCYFCVVPEKEGKLRRAGHPQEWYNPEFDKIMLLDNNILGDREWFFEVTQWCMDRSLNVWFTQGLDIRLLDVEIAERLLEMKIWKNIFFAWDHVRDEATVKEKIQVLRDAGFSDSKLRHLVSFYVYIDNDDEYETGVYRCRELKKMSCNPFVMYNIDNKKTSRIKDLQRWANMKGLFWSGDITDYKRGASRRAVI